MSEKLCSIIDQWKLMQYDSDTEPVEEEKPATKVPYLVRVTKTLEIRKGQGTSYGKADRKCSIGIYTIVEVKSGWGRLKSGAGWIQLSKTEKV